MSKVWLVLFFAAKGWGQAAPGSLNDVLLDMSAHAGVIFAGQVADVARHDADGYVDIRFRVEEPVKGCSKLGAYVLREWAGRWAGRDDRYRVGQRYLMMLTPRGPSGMSAPVYGSDGAISLGRSVAGPILGPGGVSDDAGVQTDSVVDLGLLQARVVRVATAPPVGWGDSVGIIAPFEIVPDDLPVEAPLPAVLTLLRAPVAPGGPVAR